MNRLPLLLMLVLFYFLFPAAGSTQYLAECGIHKHTEENIDSTETRYQDRFGNIYSQSYFDNLPEGTISCTNSGYFELHFIDVPSEMQTVVCEVFSYVSQTIPQRTETTECGDPIGQRMVRVNVTADIENNVEGGIGSPIDALPFTNDCTEVLLRRPYIKINGGFDYQDNTTPDGILRLNQNFDLNYDWTLDMVPANVLDLYAVVLHEALHILGYASLVQGDNTTGDIAYALWDQLLHYADPYVPGGGSTVLDPVIDSDLTANCWNLTTTGEQFQENASNTCYSPDFPDVVAGNTGIAPVAGGNGGSTIDLDQNALRQWVSHLNNECNGQDIDYVMSPAIDITQDYYPVRAITEPELQLLCELGYRVQTPDFSCDGCYTIAHFDRAFTKFDEPCCAHQFYACVGDVMIISQNELLCNDITNGDELEFIDLKLANPDPSIDIQQNGDLFEITSTAPGTSFLQYTVKGCDSKMHNMEAHIFFDQCPDCDDDHCENLFCIDDLEDLVPASAQNLGFPFLYTGTFNNSLDIKNFNGNNYLFAADFASGNETAILELKKPVEPNCTIQLSLDAAYHTPGTNTGLLNVWGSTFPPCSVLDAFVNYGCAVPTDCGGNYTYLPVCIGTFDIANHSTYDMDNDLTGLNLQTYNLEWINDQSIPLHYIILSPGTGNQLVYDNFHLGRECIDPSFSIGTICSGLIVDFTSVDQDPEYTHLWDFGDGNSSTDVNPGHPYPSEGTYTVTHTVTDECGTSVQYTQDIEVEIEEAPDPSFTYEVEFCTFNVLFISGEQTGEHLWDFGDGNSSMDPDPAHVYTEPGSYNVTHALTNDCETVEETLSITLTDCIDENCDCIEGLNITDNGGPPTNISDWLPNQAGISGSCIGIEGTLVIDETFTFYECAIFMHPGAEIIVEPNVQLSIIASLVEGCGEELWQSITVQANARLIMHQSTIRDGREAVFATDRAHLRIAESTFDRNYIGIFVPPNPQGNVIFSQLFSNHFTCNGNLLNNFDGPGLGDISFAGIRMHDATGLNIGQVSVPSNINTFSGLRNGIVGSQSIMNVHHTEIGQLTGGSIFFNSLSGIGIYAENCFDIRLSKNEFDQVYTGVHTLSTNIKQLHDCKMSETDYGIIVHLGQLTENYITGNEIHCKRLGITMASLDHAILELTGNTIHSGASGSSFTSFAGIGIYNAAFQSPADGLIGHNLVKMHQTNRGILLNHVEGIRVTDNTIDEMTPANTNSNAHCGIGLFGSLNCQVRDNTVNGLGSTSALTGIRVSNSIGTVFCCNTIDQSRQGLSFAGECDDTNLRISDVHTVQSGSLGLHLESTATLGAQIDVDPDFGTLLYGNIFANENGTVNSGATHEGLSALDVDESQFPIDPVNFPETGPDPINAVPGSNWFPFSSGTTLTCSAFPDCNIEGLLPPDETDDRDLKTAMGDNEFGIFTEGIQWEAGRHLYRKMDSYPDLHQQNSSVDSFYFANQTSSLGKLYDIGSSIEGLYFPDPVLWQNLSVLRAEMEVLIQDITYQDSLLFVTPDSLQAPVLAFRDSLLQELAARHVSAQLDLDNIQQDRTAAGIPIKATNAGIPVAEVPESNQQTLNDIYLSTIARGIGEFDTIQLARIESIAGQCPLSDGNAVFFARGLLAMVKDTIFDDEAICGTARNRGTHNDTGKQEQEYESGKEIYLYPNPAKDEVSIEFVKALERATRLTFYNVAGQEVLNIRIPGNADQYTCNIGHLENGIYFWEISGLGKKKITGKLIIFD